MKKYKHDVFLTPIVRNIMYRLNHCVSPTCSSQCCRLIQQRACHVLSCLCDNAYKRPLPVCRKSKALCPVSRPLSVPLWPAYAK